MLTEETKYHAKVSEIVEDFSMVLDAFSEALDTGTMTNTDNAIKIFYADGVPTEDAAEKILAAILSGFIKDKKEAKKD